MTYRELLDFTKKHPDCFWDKKQRQKENEYRFKLWVEQLNREYDSRNAMQNTGK